MFTPAMAQDYPEPGTAPAEPDRRPEWHGQPPASYPHQAMHPIERDKWLAECRRRLSSRDNGLGGAVIGGLVGGFAGNRIAGRGNRTVGTIAGAAVGAAAGAAIDKAEDNGRIRDECETYLDDYYAYYAQGSYGYQSYGYAYPAQGYGCCYAAPMMMVPVMPARTEPECSETVEYEYVDVPVRAKPRPVPDKRVKVVPDKRIRQ
ncbi:MAG: glycine zipper 2TM domain-containing protein [Novosphingobium sp.]|nr:glycine zipper 2TM domain-containing protein [Novosphingobium sp.]